MKSFLLFIFLFFVVVFQSSATHIRSGEICYKYIGNNTFQADVTIFSDPTNFQADNDSIVLEWGDGSVDTIPRILEQLIDANLKKNLYRGNHTYSGFGSYKISTQILNRINSIVNMNFGISDQIPLYVEDSLFFRDPAIWGPINSSPMMATEPIDYAYFDVPFQHNPGAYDIDGDSLSYEFYIPLAAMGIPVPNWISPTQVSSTSNSDIISIDPVTGIVSWTSPDFIGLINIGILITEWRKRYENGEITWIKMGTKQRDLHIIITSSSKHPPEIANINDTCIVAGSLLQIPFSTTDIDPGETIEVEGFGGPFMFTFNSAQLLLTNQVIGLTENIFKWQTVCDQVSPDYYTVVIKAQDSFSPIPLQDIESFRIKVVAPAPQNLTATPLGNNINLAWDNPYTCAGAIRFLGFSVWRREGPNPFAIDTCTPGLAGKGYAKIASNILTYTYTDGTAQIGKNYCYRVLAEFGTVTSLGYLVQFTESLPSNEACTQLNRDLPVIINVSVNNTDAVNGSIFIRWTNPLPLDLDTFQNPAPYKYEVYRALGNTSTNFNLIQTYTSNSFAGLVDTSYIDTLINTLDNDYNYKVLFFSNNDTVGETETASSIYVNITPAGNVLALSWNEIVPWINDRYVILRQNPSTFLFDSIGNTTIKSYTDTGLINDSLYCYKVRSVGSYSAPGFPVPLINFSQIKCAAPIDTVGPCAPMLKVNNECNDANYAYAEFTNFIHWQMPDISCSGDAIKYYLYYSPSSNVELQLLDSNIIKSDTSFLHALQNTVAGCYAIAAVDSYYNRGPLSNIICIDNCPEYELPNTFTPNGDGKNDFYIPLTPYRFIRSVKMKIFTSWGSLVYETTDPALGWNGIDITSGKAAPEGTYYYVCEVFEERLTAEDKASKTLSGFIHLFR